MLCHLNYKIDKEYFKNIFFENIEKGRWHWGVKRRKELHWYQLFVPDNSPLKPLFKDIEDQLRTRIGTSELNIKFRELWIKNPPHPFRGKRAKLKYVTQYSSYPPEFSFNLSSRIPKNYQMFIENNIRQNFNMKNICFKVKINA